MKITITNAYTWYNKGDAGILLGIVNALKKIYGESIEINILSFSPEEDKKRYCKDSCIKNVYSNILNPFPYKHTFLGKNLAILKLFIKMLGIYTTSKISIKKLIKKQKELEILNDSDLIVVCGGGFLGGKKYDSLIHLFQIYVNTLFGKPVIMMGTSIEPMKKGIIKSITEKVLKKLDYIYAREKITYEYLESLLSKDKFELIPDMAFMLEDDISEDFRIQELKENHKYVCGITVRKWNFPNCSNPNERMEKYIKAIVETITYFFQKYNMVFVFVPQVIVKNGNDVDIAYRIKERLLDKNSLIIIEDDISPIEIKALISNFDIFIGTRMHSNIFATTMHIPTVAIAYEKKTNGIMQTLDLDDYVIEMDTLESKELIKKVEKSLENKDKIQKKLEIKIPEIRKEIMQKLKNKEVI